MKKRWEVLSLACASVAVAMAAGVVCSQIIPLFIPIGFRTYAGFDDGCLFVSHTSEPGSGYSARVVSRHGGVLYEIGRGGHVSVSDLRSTPSDYLYDIKFAWHPPPAGYSYAPLEACVATIRAWPLAVMAGIPALVIWRSRWMEMQSRKRNRCLFCGYSLTGLAPGSPCPECGNGKRGGGEAKA